jgi:hypothetical protein
MVREIGLVNVTGGTFRFPSHEVFERTLGRFARAQPRTSADARAYIRARIAAIRAAVEETLMP